jgi:predicted DCC family thiol-disulfide oxidoreductase YuxK
LEKEIRHPIIFFDGHCILCDKTVNWIIKKDKKTLFRFVAIPQNEKFWDSIPKGYALKNANSVMLYDQNGFKTKSSAILHICKKLGLPINLLTLFFIVPPFIRNGIYSFIARNRYKWFGNYEDCLIPDESVKKRFLDWNEAEFKDFFPKK